MQLLHEIKQYNNMIKTRPYNNDYAFNTFYRNGSRTRWYQILLFLAYNGPATKAEIVKAIWGYDKDHFTYTYGWQNSAYVTNTLRGWQSNLFAQMNYQNIINYNRATRRWEVGNNPRVKQMIKTTAVAACANR